MITKAGLLRMARRRLAKYYEAASGVCIDRGEGVFLYDMDGSRYFDMLAGFGSVSLGHCHEEMVDTVHKQAGRLAMTSRSIENSVLPQTAELVCGLTGYDKFLPSSSGVEACESAVKLARRWGYRVKGIPIDQARIAVFRNCFWGRSVTACGASSDPKRSLDFGPTTPGFDVLDYGDVAAVDAYLEATPECCAVMVEPVQGEGGTIVPQDGYLAGLWQSTRRHGALLITDEVQTGFGRCGTLMGHHHDLPEAAAAAAGGSGAGIAVKKPDILVLGKALSAGYSPVSAALADDHIMNQLGLGEHGSTYGGNPHSMAVAQRAVQLLFEHDAIANAARVGAQMRASLINMARDHGDPFTVRGRGLMNAVEVNPARLDAKHFCDALRRQGILTRVGTGGVLRFTPPLVITPKEVCEACERIREALDIAMGGGGGGMMPDYFMVEPPTTMDHRIHV